MRCWKVKRFLTLPAEILDAACSGGNPAWSSHFCIYRPSQLLRRKPVLKNRSHRFSYLISPTKRDDKHFISYIYHRAFTFGNSDGILVQQLARPTPSSCENPQSTHALFTPMLNVLFLPGHSADARFRWRHVPMRLPCLMVFFSIICVTRDECSRSWKVVN